MMKLLTTEQILEAIIRKSKKSLKEYVKKCGRYNNDIEMNTIRLKLPRQSGHTTAALKVANKLFKKPLFVFFTDKFSEMFGMYNKNNKILFTTPRTLGDRILGHKCDCAFIDCTSWLREDQVHDIYKTLQVYSRIDPNFLFIFLE